MEERKAQEAEKKKARKERRQIVARLKSIGKRRRSRNRLRDDHDVPGCMPYY